MSKFKTIYGIDKKEIHTTCVIVPYLSKNLLSYLGVTKIFKGQFFSCGTGTKITLICSRIGAPFVGDSVLYLKNSKCKNIIFVGSCGILNKKSVIKKGSIVVPDISFNLESFSDLLLRNNKKLNSSKPSSDFLSQIINLCDFKLNKVRCASFGSIALENQYVDFLNENLIDVVDMETSAFFAASKYINIKSVAVLYATDFIRTNDLFKQKTQEYNNIIEISLNSICELILKSA